MSTEAMKLALEAYMAAGFGNSTDFALQRKAYDLALQALTSVPDWASEAIEQPAQQKEPVAVMELYEGGWDLVEDVDLDWLHTLPFGTKLYTSQQPAQRKPLTDEEIEAASLQAGMQEHYMGFHSGFIRFARAIEAKLKEKNSD